MTEGGTLTKEWFVGLGKNPKGFLAWKWPKPKVEKMSCEPKD